MKTIKFLALSLFLFTVSANAQITKGNWMVGGDISLSKSTFSLDDNPTSKTESTNLDITPGVGYFLVDKLAIGALYQYISSNSKFEGGKQVSKASYIGPFVRYYILKPEKTTNLFLETSYNFSTMKDKKNTVFASKVGSVFFLNSSVGLELSLKYSINKNDYNNDLISNSTSKGFTLGLGFQIHLEKDK